VAANVLFWILIVSGRNVDLPDRTVAVGRVAQIGNRTVIVGALGTIVFGIWLAIRLDHVQVWSGWVIFAIILWFVAAALGSRTGAEYEKAGKKAVELQAAGKTEPNAELLALNRTSRGLWLHVGTTVVILLVLVDMIWKPGAPDVVGVFPRSSDFNINFPLLIHVGGAMILVGGVLTAALFFLLAQGSAQRLRLGFYSLLFVALPGLILAKIGATAIWSKESVHGFIGAAFPHTDDPRWVEIGGTALDGGGALLVLALILGWFGLKRLDGGEGDFLAKVPVVKNMSGATLLKGSTIISVVLLVGYVLAIWAMGTKPS
jgi:hypothetical protein